MTSSRTQRLACQEDPELFFPLTYTGAAQRLVAEAKRLCQACPLQQSCLQQALRDQEEFGIFGGSTPEERQAIATAGTLAAATDPGHRLMTSLQVQRAADWARVQRLVDLARANSSASAAHGQRPDPLPAAEPLERGWAAWLLITRHSWTLNRASAQLNLHAKKAVQYIADLATTAGIPLTIPASAMPNPSQPTPARLKAAA